MRQVPDTMTEAFYNGTFVGDRRPIARVTIQHPEMRLHPTPENVFANFLFGRFEQASPMELPNVRSVAWERDVDQAAASCTVTLWNVEPLPPGVAPTPGVLDQPGYYTYNRGRSPYAPMAANEWSDVLMPDNILRTYEGYGSDYGVCPSDDPFLVQTGTWMIDRVTYNADGTISCECRDMIRLLMDQIAYLPVVPEHAGFVNDDVPDGAYSYPVSFSSQNSVPTVKNVPLDPQRLTLNFYNSSNQPYTNNGPVYGHAVGHAFDDDDATYWLSIGNQRPDQGYSFEWIEGVIPRSTVRRVKFRTFGQGYTCFLGLYVEGQGWIGDHVVPYDPNHPASAPNGSDERYYMAMGVPVEQRGPDYWTFDIPEGVGDVVRIRLTFGGLFYTAMGTYPYRAGVRIFQAFGGPVVRTETTHHYDRNYDDYTDIVKLLCAWAGFYWPRSDVYERSCDGTRRRWVYENDDEAMTIKWGRVWGDFQPTGTAGPANLGPEIFDKKPLIDGINHIKDITGFLFYADELGGAVWRPPNIYEFGNTMRTLSSRSGERDRNLFIHIYDTQVIESLNATLDSSNVRERNFVSTANGRYAGLSEGWNPNKTGLRRVGGWTDQHFESDIECQIMAELISIRQLFTYRKDQLAIPGFPAIQVDDQVRLYERVTGEGFVHYVRGISSTLDMESGEWTYELTTHWLGNRAPIWRADNNQIRTMLPIEREDWVFILSQVPTESARRMLEEMVVGMQPGEGDLEDVL